MGIISSITSFGGNVWRSATGAAQTAYSTYVAPTVVTVARPVSTAVSTVTRPVTTAFQQNVLQPAQQQVQTKVIQPFQQNVIRPAQQQVQTKVIQPFQQNVLQPAQQQVQTKVIQPFQQNVIKPAAYGINLAPKVITSVAAPGVIQQAKTTVLATPGKITSAVIAGAASVPGIRQTQISVTQPVTGGGMGGINTRPSLNILGSIPAAGGKLVSTGLGAVTSLKSAAGAVTLSGVGNVTKDIFGVRHREFQRETDAYGQSVGAYNLKSNILRADNDALATEAGWINQNITKMKSFGGQIEQNFSRVNQAIGDFNKLPAPRDAAEYNARVARADELVADANKLVPMVGQYDEMGNRLNVMNQTFTPKYEQNLANAAAHQKEGEALNQTGAALETKKQQIESTGLGGIYKRFGNEPEDRILGIIPNPFAKYDDRISSILAKSPIRRTATKIHEELDRGGVAVTEPKILQGPVPQFAYGVVQGYAEDAQTRPTKFVGEMAAGFSLAKIIPAVAGPATRLGSKLPGATTVATKATTIKTSIPVIKNIPTGKLVEGGMLAIYGAGTTIKALEQPTPLESGKVFGRAGTELTGLYLGAGLAGRVPLRASARAAYDATARAGTRIIETRPFQSASKSLTGGWERAFGRISPSKVTFTPGRGIKRPGVDPVRMVFQRDTGVWVPTTKQPSVTGRYTLGQRGKSPVGGTPKRGLSSMDIPENVLARVRSMAAQSPGKERTAIFGEAWKQKWVPQIGTKKTTSFIPRSGKALFHSHPKGTVSPSRADLKGLSYEYEGIVTPKGDILVMKRPPGGWPKGDALSSAISSKGVRPALREFGIQKMFIEAPPTPKSPTMKMNWNRATGKWQPAASQAKSRWDFLKVDRASFAKAQPKTYSESNWRFIEANRPSMVIPGQEKPFQSLFRSRNIAALQELRGEIIGGSLLDKGFVDLPAAGKYRGGGPVRVHRTADADLAMVRAALEKRVAFYEKHPIVSKTGTKYSVETNWPKVKAQLDATAEANVARGKQVDAVVDQILGRNSAKSSVGKVYEYQAGPKWVRLVKKSRVESPSSSTLESRIETYTGKYLSKKPGRLTVRPKDTPQSIWQEAQQKVLDVARVKTSGKIPRLEKGDIGLESVGSADPKGFKYYEYQAGPSWVRIKKAVGAARPVSGKSTAVTADTKYTWEAGGKRYYSYQAGPSRVTLEKTLRSSGTPAQPTESRTFFELRGGKWSRVERAPKPFTESQRMAQLKTQLEYHRFLNVPEYPMRGMAKRFEAGVAGTDIAKTAIIRGRVFAKSRFPPETPLSWTFGKRPSASIDWIETGAKPSSATALVIPKEKPVSPPSTPKEMGRSTVMQDMNRALGSDTVLARAPTGQLAPGEVMDAYGIDIPTARRRRPRFFDDDTVAAYGPLALGGGGTASVSNLRDQYDSATDRARGSFSGISIIPSIALVGETGLGSRTITTPTISVKPPEPQKYDPVAVPKLRFDPLRAQAPGIASITAPQFATGQIPGLGQLNLQTPAIGQVNLQMPAMDQLTLQQPALDQMQIQRPALDTFTYQVPAFEPPTLPPFEFPPMPIPVIPPFTPPPMAGAGGGGGGGMGGFRTGMEFVETMPLGDFLSDTFGTHGMDFGGMNDVSSASFMSGAWGGAKPKKTKRRKR